MKILFLFTYNKGLLSNFFMELAHKLTNEGHEVKVYSLKTSPEIIWLGKIEVTVETKGGYLRNYMQIFKYIKEFSPDVIISNFSYANPALLAGKLLTINKNIIWTHSLKNQVNPRRHQIFIKQQFYNLADKVIVNSHILQKELREIFKVKGSKINVIPFWSNISEIESSPIKVENSKENFCIGCPGRITEDKNQTVLVDAIARIKHNNKKKIEVYFAGEGQMREKLEKKIHKMNFQEQVTFLGILSAGEMVDFYKKMDVIVLPSLYESFGLVFIEAISLGTPVIVSTEFGALDFVEKESEDIKKILFDPQNSENLACMLENMLIKGGFNKEFYKKIYSDNFDKEIIYKKIYKVLED